MAEVHAVKDTDTIKLVSHLLQVRYGQQMADIWNVGINLALRISDLLSIRFDDIKEDRLTLKESKTGHTANIQLNPKAKTIIERIKEDHPDHLYLFQSHRTTQIKHRAPKPLSRRVVSKAFEAVGKELKLPLGTHSMRKTRGYHLYHTTKDITRVMRMLRHRSEAVTLRYIGLTQEQVDKDFRELVL